jgi:hypothetical protein
MYRSSHKDFSLFSNSLCVAPQRNGVSRRFFLQTFVGGVLGSTAAQYTPVPKTTRALVQKVPLVPLECLVDVQNELSGLLAVIKTVQKSNISLEDKRRRIVTEMADRSTCLSVWINSLLANGALEQLPLTPLQTYNTWLMTDSFLDVYNHTHIANTFREKLKHIFETYDENKLNQLDLKRVSILLTRLYTKHFLEIYSIKQLKDVPQDVLHSPQVLSTRRGLLSTMALTLQNLIPFTTIKPLQNSGVLRLLNGMFTFRAIGARQIKTADAPHLEEVTQKSAIDCVAAPLEHIVNIIVQGLLQHAACKDAKATPEEAQHFRDVMGLLTSLLVRKNVHTKLQLFLMQHPDSPLMKALKHYVKPIDNKR